MDKPIWGDRHEERDAEGNLTDLALACSALADNGCDCGEDEPGTCLGCRCEKALYGLWNKLQEHPAHPAIPKEVRKYLHRRIEGDQDCDYYDVDGSCNKCRERDVARDWLAKCPVASRGIVVDLKLPEGEHLYSSSPGGAGTKCPEASDKAVCPKCEERFDVETSDTIACSGPICCPNCGNDFEIEVVISAISPQREPKETP